MPSLVDKFFNIFNFIIGINSQHEDIENELSRSVSIASYKVDRVMINEFVKLSNVKNNPESIERKISDESSKVFIERKFKTSLDTVTTFDEIIKVTKSEKIGLIVGKAGYGKSRTVKKICEIIQMTEKNDKLVFHINLSDFIEKFKRNDLNFNEKFSLKFLLSFNSYEYEVFKDLVQNERIIVFIDGFNETAVFYKNELINLLQSIRRNTKVSLWLTARPSNARQLEYELKAKTFELLPFTHEDAKDYLHSILSQISYDRSKFEKMLESFFANASNLKQPIVLAIIEEILLDRHANESLTEDVNLIHVYIKRKIEFGEFCDSSLLSLLSLAIRTVFGDKILSFGAPRDKIDRVELFKSHLVTYACDNNEIEFVDRSFAAYFIAEYVIKNVWIYGAFFPSFDGDKRLLGQLLKQILDVGNHAKYSLIYDNVKSIIECGKVKERIKICQELTIKSDAFAVVSAIDITATFNHQINRQVNVLKLTKLANLNSTFELLSSEKFHQFLSLNPHIFALILEFTDSSDFNDQNVANYLQYINMKCRNPPLILSFECIATKSSSIFHYGCDKYHRTVLADITEEKFLQTIKNDFGIGVLLSAIKSRVIGSFYGKFEHMRLRSRDFYGQKKLIDYALERCDETCIKFLQIFESVDVFAENLNSQTILEVAAQNCGEKELRMLAGDDILSTFKGRDGKTLLMTAARVGNANAVKFLLKLNADVDFKVNGKSAADFAYKNRHYNVLILLLNANSEFPLNFDKSVDCESSSPADREKLSEFIKISQSMHDSILNENHRQIDTLCRSHPHLRHFYSLSNESALAYAMRSQKTHICRLLSSKGLSLAPSDEASENLIDKLEWNANKVSVIDECLKSILSRIFISGSSLTESEMKEVRREIANSLMEMSNLPGISEIFEATARVENLEVIFECTRQVPSGSQQKVNKIIIDARQISEPPSKAKIFAHLAQKLCQTAMQSVFQNDGNPYTSTDVDLKLKFFKITKHCYENCDKDNNMRTIFRSFNSEKWHKELIALVPFMTVLYQRNEARLDFVRTHFSELFEFYENFIVIKI